MNDVTNSTATFRKEFPGRIHSRTAGGGIILKLKTARRTDAPCMIAGSDLRKLDTLSGLLVVYDEELAERLELAIKQSEEAYDEEKRCSAR